MHSNDITENNIEIYLFYLSGAACALSAVWDACDIELSEKKRKAIDFLVHEIDCRTEAIVEFSEDNERIIKVKDRRDVYKILAEKQKLVLKY
ncbi:hypothetical protein LB105_004240 [Salmonella enterica]|uniref:Uncharacterized protein n=1 Tax=Salmonella enterica TaxID=28901 RepID=A0A7D8IWB2_SALER|nr:hypothetical protein [Salmonella enterica]EDR2901127.1 hypothetical protein [Salmonella enterica subsp. enterica serovar Amherstiana]EDX6462381.1 hypothetical protein [Salmonella enterica subsp. diarizonae serovar 60:r:e,n,x,z15]EDJ1489121.1 hypothetical protein [Salmonella enterica]EID3014310.1 hypothetical protein [Salmonella enterica]